MDFRLIIFSTIFLFVIIIPIAHAQVLDENSIQRSVKVEINSKGEVHVTHDIKPLDSPHQIDLINGTVTNLTISDQNGNEIHHGTIDQNSFLILPSNEDTIIEYDLSDVLNFKNNFWSWDFLYPQSTSFYFPPGVDLVFADNNPAFLADKKGIICHGCKMKLEYSLNEPRFLKEIKLQQKNYLIEFRTWEGIENFNFDKDFGGLKFKVLEKDNYFISTAIPKDLIAEPFNVFLDDEKIIFHKFNDNGTHVWLNIRPQHSGEVAISGTVIPIITNNETFQIKDFPVEYIAIILVGIAIGIGVFVFKRKR